MAGIGEKPWKPGATHAGWGATLTGANRTPLGTRIPPPGTGPDDVQKWAGAWASPRGGTKPTGEGTIRSWLSGPQHGVVLAP